MSALPKAIRFIDMFCGIGGFRLGLEKANQSCGEYLSEQTRSGEYIRPIGNKPDNKGEWAKTKQEEYSSQDFNCVWANDNDKYACQIYRRHFGELYEGDIRAVDASAIPEHDLLCAGFPCQSFSIAGKRRGFEDTRGTLFFEICRVLQAKRPSYLFLENVKGLLSHDNGDTFETIIRALDELGYGYQWDCLNSKDYGVPQNRERVFIVGHLRGKSRPKVFPIREDNQGVDEGADEATSVRTLQGGGHSGGHHSGMTVIQIGHRTKGRPRYYEGEIPAMTQDYGTGGQNVPLVAQAIRAEHHNTADVHYLPGIRRLTPLECERLQGFPDGWTEGISDTQRYKCLGNAVTVNVIEAIGRQLLEGLND